PGDHVRRAAAVWDPQCGEPQAAAGGVGPVQRGLCRVSRKLRLADGEASRTACARVVIRCGVGEKTGDVLTAAALAERVGWCADVVAGVAGVLLAEHWSTCDVDMRARGVDAGGRKLPSNAWMALRRLGWSTCAWRG